MGPQLHTSEQGANGAQAGGSRERTQAATAADAAAADVTGGADGVEQTIAESQRDTSAETKRYILWSTGTKTVAETKSEKRDEFS